MRDCNRSRILQAAGCCGKAALRFQTAFGRLRQDFDFGLRFDQGVKFVDFAVGYGNAAVRPVAVQVLCADCAHTVPHAVDFDVAARTFALRGGIGAVGIVGIRNAEVFMIAAVGIAVVDGVAAFRGFTVALELFVSDGIETQGDGIGFQQSALCVVGIHFVVSFADDEFGDFAVGRQGRLPGNGRANCCASPMP